MATNRQIEAALAYHERTKHSFQSLRASVHRLEWENQPLPFKIYKGLQGVPLPRDLGRRTVPALRAINASHGSAAAGEAVPDIGTLARLLFYSAGITKVIEYPHGRMLFRAASCTGALYHIDIYVVCGALPGLDAGVYHFGVHDFALHRLMRGDYRAEVAGAAAGEQAVANAPVTFIFTSTFWRNAWKYRERTYRHCFWDSGTIIANFLAMARAEGFAARLVCGFVDDRVNPLLGLNSDKENALALIPLGRVAEPLAPAPALAPMVLETEPLSAVEVDYPAIREAHEASKLRSEDEVAAWRGSLRRAPPDPPSGRLIPVSEPATADDSVEEVILRRGSTRRFSRDPLRAAELAAALRAVGPVDSDFSEPGIRLLNDVYLIVNAVEDLLPGAYLYRPEENGLELLREGAFRAEAGYLGLEQALPADAAVNIYFLCDLRPVLERFGNRGYRIAQLEAAINGGRIYLTAYALRFGATGLTFYDDDVTDFFSPSAAGKSVMFHMALGRPAPRTGTVRVG
jgi:SagB-type dehydrogenase family enzyme